MGFDDIPFARYTSPPLTTAEIPADELGAQASTRMRELLEGGEPGHPLTLLPESTLRASTGPTPG